MTVTDSFPLGYFYIVSKFNGLVLDIDKTEPIVVRKNPFFLKKKIMK